MNIKIKMNSHIIEWLASMGYPVSNMPREAIEGIFLREARQWEVPPERLEEMVREGYHASESFRMASLMPEMNV